MHPPLDATDVVCQAADQARHLSLVLCVGSLLAVVIAWRVRDRVAAAGHQSLWALCCLLAGALQVIACLALVPTGCTHGELVSTFIAATAPWILAAGLFRTGIAPTPPPLRTDFRERDPTQP